MGDLADTVVRAATERLPRGTRVLVACSGGADSVALAGAAAEVAEVALGHVDHGLRPESATEAEHVCSLAARLRVPFFLERLSGLDVRRDGLEASARTARYAALGRLAQKAGAPVVATAHTRRDQAETLLLRLIRGAGPGALAGVRRSRALAGGIELVRPLLDVSRAATEAFCRERSLPYVQDPHNVDPRRARARLRSLWPALLELNPRLEEALGGAAGALADEDALLDSLLPKDLTLQTLRALHPALFRRAVLKAAASHGVHPERQHFAALHQLVQKARGSLDLPGGRAILRSGELCFDSREACSPRPGASAALAIPGPGHYAWLSRELTVASGRGEGCTVDLARAPFPWTLRGHRPGDRFRPAGGRTRKVADLWIDARIPREERKALAVLADASGTLFWVEGVREGAPSRGSFVNPAVFRIRPEMKPSAGTLGRGRQRESGSATMDPRPDEEPR